MPVAIIDNVVDQAKYVVNVWSQNNSPAAAGVAGIVKKGNVLSSAASPATRSSRPSRTAPSPPSPRAPDSRSPGTIYGKWTNSSAKAETLKWLASHPDTQIDAVIQNGIMMAGIVQAFQQAGRHVPPISGGGCQGGDLSVAQNKATYKTVANCFYGYQTAWSEFRRLARILDGRGLKVRDIHVPVPLVTNKNLHIFATPGKPLSWPGEPRGPSTAGPTTSSGTATSTRPATPPACNDA